jgi:sugar O-acyltransferase (sialic acid O-acetyltransferase NeuD family)
VIKKLIIFGVGEIAELAHYYFSTDSAYEVAGFTVDGKYMRERSFCNLPVVPFEEILFVYPPSDYDIFIALSYTKINAVRKEKFLAALNYGYTLASYISSKSTILSDRPLGKNCLILEGNTIQPFATIGNNVTLWSGNHIGHHSNIKDHVFIASQVVISGGVTVGEQCFIGVNATIRDHVTIGNSCVIGAGVILLANADPDGVYMAQGSDRSKVPSYRLRGI